MAEVLGIEQAKKFLIVDFWNHGTVSSGCISAAKSGDYFCIDWNKNIMPCVFFPYTTMNIADGNVDAEINWLIPCPISNHHSIALRIIDKYGAKLGEGNDPLMESAKYTSAMEEYR